MAPDRRKFPQLDYFQWNFLFGFVYIAALLAVAVAIAHPRENTAVLLVSLPLPLLAFQISSQLVFGSMLVCLRAKYPFRVSSMAKGALVRPGVYTIIEDVVAVDGGHGVHFRQLMNASYISNKALQALLQWMGWAWGLSGLGVSILLLALIGSLADKEISYVLGVFFTNRPFLRKACGVGTRTLTRGSRLERTMGMGGRSYWAHMLRGEKGPDLPGHSDCLAKRTVFLISGGAGDSTVLLVKSKEL
ncbi:uncharacterized protein LDX57_006941 [Aspergillus melleus]|uniref:uncharacterized protein n=1 Tax=Aspergillus melleus TaxID=138277 RepID=UPI001E8CC287|nr:uncharacterized protein LDX57_006941 [Aspergillus melleus]KAH8429274.1 hypothetical protein LDX57_006941 [Aspergillus melleus]